MNELVNPFDVLIDDHSYPCLKEELRAAYEQINMEMKEYRVEFLKKEHLSLRAASDILLVS